MDRLKRSAKKANKHTSKMRSYSSGSKAPKHIKVTVPYTIGEKDDEV